MSLRAGGALKYSAAWVSSPVIGHDFAPDQVKKRQIGPLEGKAKLDRKQKASGKYGSMSCASAGEMLSYECEIIRKFPLLLASPQRVFLF